MKRRRQLILSYQTKTDTDNDEIAIGFRLSNIPEVDEKDIA